MEFLKLYIFLRVKLFLDSRYNTWTYTEKKMAKSKSRSEVLEIKCFLCPNVVDSLSQRAIWFKIIR